MRALLTGLGSSACSGCSRGRSRCSVADGRCWRGPPRPDSVSARFRISAAERDLNYCPVIPYELGWAETITWFRSARQEQSAPSPGTADLALQDISCHGWHWSAPAHAESERERCESPADHGCCRVPCATAACAASYREKWLPTLDLKAGGYAGKIAKQTQKKIDIQAAPLPAGAGAASASCNELYPGR